MPDFKASLTQGGVPVSLDGHSHASPIPYGVVFPASPAQVDNLFFRTDQQELCRFDGSYWIGSVQQIPLQYTRLSPYTTTGYFCAFLTRAVKLYGLYSSLYVQTTNNASNYWTMQLYLPSAGVYKQRDTAGNTANTNYTYDDAGLTYITSSGQLTGLVTKTGAPGGLIPYLALYAARIYT
jgi:hypothetical protein